MIPTHFVDRMSKTLSGWLEGEGMSERQRKRDEARARTLSLDVIQPPFDPTHDPNGGWKWRIARLEAERDRLADRVEELEAAANSLLSTAHIEVFDHATTQLIVLDDVLAEFRQALSPPMDE